VRWSVTLEGRVECSATITGDFSEVTCNTKKGKRKRKEEKFKRPVYATYFVQVVVGCYKGKIYFLDISTGEPSWTFQTDGEVL
jgi:acyl-CoA synthetase